MAFEHFFRLSLAEHVSPKTGEQRGNFVQTCSMAGLINFAIRLSSAGTAHSDG